MIVMGVGQEHCIQLLPVKLLPDFLYHGVSGVGHPRLKKNIGFSPQEENRSFSNACHIYNFHFLIHLSRIFPPALRLSLKLQSGLLSLKAECRALHQGQAGSLLRFRSIAQKDAGRQGVLMFTPPSFSGIIRRNCTKSACPSDSPERLDEPGIVRPCLLPAAWAFASCSPSTEVPARAFNCHCILPAGQV